MGFEPANGAVARWKIIYGKFLAGRNPGDVITYQEICGELGLDPVSGRHKIRAALERARLEFLEADKHALIAVPGVGYRVAEPARHVELARRHHDRAGRALEVSHSLVANVDLGAMDPETRKATMLTVMALAAQMDFNRRVGLRQDRLEQNLAMVSVRSDRNEDEIREIKERLARVENPAGG